MNNSDSYTCYVCEKTIPKGTTFLSVSVQREHFVPDDDVHDVDGVAECVFYCHEECIPDLIEVDLTPFK